MPALREHEHFFLLLWGQLRTPALGLINCFENPSLGGESPSIVDEYPEYSDEKVLSLLRTSRCYEPLK